MNQSEYVALADNELSPEAVVLYLRGFRRFMDYKTGCVSPSLQRLMSELEYYPRRGSKVVPSKPTKSKIRILVKELIRFGLLEIVSKGDIRSGQSAIYRCNFSSFKSKSASVRLDEEQHLNSTKTATLETTPQTPSHKQSSNYEQHIQKSEEQHRSVTLYKDECIYARDLIFDNELRQTARLVGLVDDESTQVDVIFIAFTNSPNHRNKFQQREQWLADWRSFCAYWRANRSTKGKGHAKGNKSNGGYQHPIASGFEESRRSAIWCEENGVDASILDEINACAERQS